MTSREVLDAVGAAPERATPEQEARAEIEAERKAEVKARTRKIEAARAAQRNEADRRERAVRWCTEAAAREDADRERIEALWEKAGEQTREAVAAIQNFLAAVRTARTRPLARTLFGVRFPDLDLPKVEDGNPFRVATLKQQADQLSDALAAIYREADGASRRSHFESASRACAGPLERRRDALRALGKFVDRHGASLPTEVIELIEPVPDPDRLPGLRQEIAETNARTAGPGVAAVLSAIPGSAAGA